MGWNPFPAWPRSSRRRRDPVGGEPAVDAPQFPQQYKEEALAGREAALWLASESLTVEHAGHALSRYDVAQEPGRAERLKEVGRPILFETPFEAPQPRLFGLDEAGWLKALRLREYAPHGPRRPVAVQGVLFPYAEAL